MTISSPLAPNLLIISFHLQSTNSFTFRTFDMVKEFYLTHMFTFFLSNAVYLFMEGPLISLYKYYSGQKQRSEIRRESVLNEQARLTDAMANGKLGQLKND